MSSSSIWRYIGSDTVFESCASNVELFGTFVPLKKGLPIHYLAYFQYIQSCYNGKPAYSVSKLRIDRLPMVENDWKLFVGGQKDGTFMYSIYPTIYSVSAAAAVACFLTALLITNTSKPSKLLIVGSALCSINLIYILSLSIEFLHENTASGYVSGQQLLSKIAQNLAFSIIDLFTVTILDFCQVQIIMRLFNRSKEKNFALFLGGFLALIAQTIWGISNFNLIHKVQYSSQPYDPDMDSLGMLPAFVYLLRIAMSMVYSVLIALYCFIKCKFIIKKNLILISFVSIISTYFQLAFFVADLANVWVSDLSEVFNAVGLVVSTVMVWEWINRIQLLEEQKEHQGSLGRPLYEDELININNVDRFSLFIDELNDLSKRSSDDNINDNNDIISHENKSANTDEQNQRQVNNVRESNDDSGSFRVNNSPEPIFIYKQAEIQFSDNDDDDYDYNENRSNSDFDGLYNADYV